MSFLSVIEETSSALKFVWIIAVKLKDSRKEIAAVEKSMHRVNDLLTLLKSRMKDRSSAFSKAGAKITKMLKDDIKDINESIKEARVILEQRETIPWWEWGSKGVWILKRVPHLKLIASRFDSSTTNIDNLISIIQTDALQDANKAAAGRDKKREAQIDKLIKVQKEAKKSHDKELKKLGVRLQLIQEKGPKAFEDAAIHPGSDEKPKAWVKELVAGGMKESDAQKIIDGIINDLREEHKERPDEIQRAATVRSEKEADKPNPKAEEVKTPKPKKRRDTSKKSILIVDASNGPRSIMAQIYLEFVRAWTMNNQKYWLFEHIQTAGVLIPTKFTTPYLNPPTDTTPRKGISRDKNIIAAISGEDSYFWTDTYPNEKAAILERLQTQKSKGLSESDFTNYEYIVCFDIKTRDFLRELRDIVIARQKEKKGDSEPVKAFIHCLEGCPWKSADRDPKARKEYLQQVCGKVKFAIKDQFLKKEFGWERPPMSISRGGWRTLQVVVKKEKLKIKVGKGRGDKDKDMKIGSGKWWEEWKKVVKKVEKKEGCKVFLESRGESVLSICGPRDKLKGARKMVLDE